MAKKKKSRFAGRVNTSAKRTRKEASSFGYLALPKEVKMYSAEPGKVEKFDIIPYEVTNPNHPNKTEMLDNIWWNSPFKVHKNIGVNDESVVCPTTFGKKCPICEYFAKRKKEGAEWDELKMLRPSNRALYAVIPKDHKKYEEKIHIFDMSTFLFEELLIDETLENDDYESFADPEAGYTLKVRWSAESFNGNAFAKAKRIDFADRDEQYDENIIEEVPKLDELFKLLSYEAINAKFFELDDEKVDMDEEEEEEKPVRKRKKKTSVPEPEEEDVEDDDDEEEAPKPIRRKKKAAKPAPEPDDDEDDEEEEKPTKKTKGKCPFGHKFGIDTEEYDDCDECDLWEACSDKKDEA